MGQPFGIPQVAETGGNRRQMHRKLDARCIELGDQFLDSSRMMPYARVCDLLFVVCYPRASRTSSKIYIC